MSAQRQTFAPAAVVMDPVNVEADRRGPAGSPCGT